MLGNALGLSREELVHLINADLLTCGIASIVQALGVWKVGARLPLVQGVTSTAVSPMIAIGTGAGGGTAGLLAVYGAVITAGIATFLFAPVFSKPAKCFPPVVIGTILTIIGITLIPVALDRASSRQQVPAEQMFLRGLLPGRCLPPHERPGQGGFPGRAAEGQQETRRPPACRGTG
ncbi:solute carrier family 23 protein [Streptomyces xanthophaeus]|uniref:solute carrier family 23 protein n=1 Tax=Streptomyces xanthophaeus TaxID=67385 RepID=UPI00386C2274